MEPTLHHLQCPETPFAEPHRMAYWQWGDSDAAHAVLCVHGLTRQGRDFDVLARALVEKSHQSGNKVQIICPDVVGRGQSDWLDNPMAYQIPTYAADIFALFTHLVQQNPALQSIDWVGTSMGGLIGISLCGQTHVALPIPLRRMVINDVGPTIEWSSLARIGQYVGKMVPFESLEHAAATMRDLFSSFGTHTEEQWLALCRPMVKGLSDLTWHYDPAIALPFQAVTYESATQGEAALWGLYDGITVPTLLLRGADSDLLSPATAHAMTERGPRAKLVEFAGVGHAPTLIAADQVEAVSQFLLPPEFSEPQ